MYLFLTIEYKQSHTSANRANNVNYKAMLREANTSTSLFVICIQFDMRQCRNKLVYFVILLEVS